MMNYQLIGKIWKITENQLKLMEIKLKLTKKSKKIYNLGGEGE